MPRVHHKMPFLATRLELQIGKFQCPRLLANDWVLVTVVHEQTNGAELHRKEGDKMYFILLYAVIGRLADSAALRNAPYRKNTFRLGFPGRDETPEYRLQLAVLPSNVWPNL
ncbi:hypothetical protein I7I48_00570 [Histoplasma ohiense]|nr:hypothetical protein I7I48_00570 [Histoplasma ohiense (nom. inval.)]